MDQAVLKFDQDLNDCTQILSSIKQLTYQRDTGIQQKQNQNLMKIEQELRQNIEKLKIQMPQIENMCLDISRNNLRYKITKQESERRMNQFQNLKSQFIQQQQAAFSTQRKVELSVQQQQQILFQGRQDDIEMQNMSAQDLRQNRKQMAQKENQALEETNTMLEGLIQKQKNLTTTLGDHNEKLENINDRADKVTQKMESMQDRFENLLRTTSNNTLWILIIINIFIMVFLVSM